MCRSYDFRHISEYRVFRCLVNSSLKIRWIKHNVKLGKYELDLVFQVENTVFIFEIKYRSKETDFDMILSRGKLLALKKAILKYFSMCLKNLNVKIRVYLVVFENRRVQVIDITDLL